MGKKGVEKYIISGHRAVNSAGECYLHTVEVTSSILVPPTIFSPHAKLLLFLVCAVLFGTVNWFYYIYD